MCAALSSNPATIRPASSSSVHDQQQAAIDFVLHRGNDLERARLRYLLNGRQPPDGVREDLARAQRSDGGWSPVWSPEYSSIDATCFQLTLARQAGVDPFDPLIIDALRFLAERQRLDGSWEEEASEAEAAPPWAAPGDTTARLYLTANAGLSLATGNFLPGPAREAADYLRASQASDGRLPSFLHTHWLAAALWQRLDDREAATRSLAYLDTRLEDLSAGNLAWLLLSLLEAGVPPSALVAMRSRERLLALCAPEGYWPGDDDADNAVHVTIEALAALHLYERRL